MGAYAHTDHIEYHGEAAYIVQEYTTIMMENGLDACLMLQGVFLKMCNVQPGRDLVALQFGAHEPLIYHYVDLWT